MSASVLRVHGWCTSPFSHKVVMAMVHGGIDFEWVPAAMMSRRDLERATGAAKIPVLEAGDEWLTDSTRILRWLDARFPDCGLYPTNPDARMRCELLEDWADEALLLGAHFFVWTDPQAAAEMIRCACEDNPTFETRFGGFMFRRIGPKMFRKLARTHHGPPAQTRRIFEDQLDLLERLLGDQPFLFGASPVAADFAVAGQLVNLTLCADRELLSSRPGLASMVGRCAQLLPERAGITSGQAAVHRLEESRSST